MHNYGLFCSSRFISCDVVPLFYVWPSYQLIIWLGCRWGRDFPSSCLESFIEEPPATAPILPISNGYKSNYSRGVPSNLSHCSKSNYSESVPNDLSQKSHHRLGAVTQGLATRQYVFPGQLLLLQMQSQKFHQLPRQPFDMLPKQIVTNSASVPKTFLRQKSFSQSCKQVLKIQILSHDCKTPFPGVQSVWV